MQQRHHTSRVVSGTERERLEDGGGWGIVVTDKSCLTCILAVLLYVDAVGKFEFARILFGFGFGFGF